MFGGCGEGRGELMDPTGVSIDTSGMVYVTEYGNDRVSVFTSEGQYVISFGRELHDPRGVVVDSSGVVYVCDSMNNRVVLAILIVSHN